ncbi:MAG: chemotaxis protein methyltransferase CheR [Gemmataceae bacterium]|nr:chemotaxis protein methyltransferase CheR [Gemmataceae bacterium]
MTTLPDELPHPDEGSLRQTEERYRLLVEGVKDYAIFMLDPNGRVETWNVGAERIKGYSAREIIGRHFSVFYPPEDVAAGKTDMELRVAAADGRFEDEGWRVRKDGSMFWANVAITALRDSTGTLRGFAKVTRDLTARWATEDQARRLAGAEAARVEAEAAARQKDEYLAMLAHELRAPLAPLLNIVEVLRRSGGDPLALADGLDRVERQARHLRRLVDDLMEASRVARGRVTILRERLDLSRVVRMAVADRRPLLEKAGRGLSAEMPETPVWVSGDDARLTQVLANLLDNAAKYTDPGGRVEVRLVSELGRAVLTVRDTGIGIPPDVLPRLFTPFTQADRTLERERGGLGLGLSVVKGLVELHGGEVEAGSEGPGRGAEFTVRLPLEPEPSALAQTPADREFGRGGRRIVVIEDQPDAAESLKVLLELLGHEVRVAYTGPEGVGIASTWGPDVVVSDLGLPGLDGYGVARELRLRPATARVRLVALTGYGADEDRRRAAEAGFDYLLTKPADPAELVALLGEPPTAAV